MREDSGPIRSGRSGPKLTSRIALARARVSRHLSRRLSYCLTHEEAHQLIDAAEDERGCPPLKLLWKTGVRVSEAIWDSTFDRRRN